MMILKIGLVVFIAAAVLFIGVSALRRWRADRNLLDLGDPLTARYSSPLAGNWTAPIEDNEQIVAEETVDDDPDWPGKLRR